MATAFQLSGNVMRRTTAKITQMKVNVVGQPSSVTYYPELSAHTIIQLDSLHNWIKRKLDDYDDDDDNDDDDDDDEDDDDDDDDDVACVAVSFFSWCTSD